MNHIILQIGEAKEEYFRAAFAEYQKRMNAFGSLQSVPLKPAKTPGRALSDDEIRKALEKEGEEFKKQLAQPKLSRAFKIALCIEGKAFSSEQFADLLNRTAGKGAGSIVYLIGGSWGISEEIKAMCDLSLSFSPMTFAHSLFRVMLAEQIYRAEGILAGNQYHK